jgi:hypothetical protein
MNAAIKLTFVAAAFVAAGAMESQDMDNNKNDQQAYKIDVQRLEEIERLEQSLKDAPEHERKYILAAIEGLKK